MKYSYQNITNKALTKPVNKKIKIALEAEKKEKTNTNSLEQGKNEPNTKVNTFRFYYNAQQK